ncbi:hypothetical protein VB005_02311 [Metarhizium brunneum]
MHLYETLQRENLLEKPSQWTTRHVDFLCSFEDPLPAPDDDCLLWELGPSRAVAVACLLKQSDLGWRRAMMRNLLAHSGSKFE